MHLQVYRYGPLIEDNGQTSHYIGFDGARVAVDSAPYQGYGKDCEDYWRPQEVINLKPDPFLQCL